MTACSACSVYCRWWSYFYRFVEINHTVNN